MSADRRDIDTKYAVLHSASFQLQKYLKAERYLRKLLEVHFLKATLFYFILLFFTF